MARLITQAQFARRSGYSPARITQLVKEGVITLTKGKIDAAQAEAAIEANIDRSRQLKSQAKSQAANGHARGRIASSKVSTNGAPDRRGKWQGPHHAIAH
jgi:hypothetical protein